MSQHFNFFETSIKNLFRIERIPIVDSRGFFSRFYCEQDFSELSPSFKIVQINHTLTMKKGAIRGLHFQYPPHTETKIITCIQGKVFDVAVDIRNDSPTYLQWHAEILSEENQRSLYVPDGFAHGFQTLTENCQLLYLHSEFYSPAVEGAINVMDPKLAIEWPLQVTEISERDKNHPMLDGNFEGVSII